MSVKLNHVTKVFEDQIAVNDISFELVKGQIVGFLGPNGAGKSTTMKMIVAYLPATSGTIEVCGYDTAQSPYDVKKKIGYLPESNPLYYDMYVREYLEFIFDIHQIAVPKKQRIDQVIEQTGLTREVGKIIGQLSKGYKQRVGLARAILHDPQVLILDEPTSGLDPNQIIEIRDLITSLGKEKTVLLSTHIMQEVQAICQRVLIIDKGNLVADRPIDEIGEAVNQKNLKVKFSSKIDANKMAKDLQLKVRPINDYEVLIEFQGSEANRRKIMKWAVNEDLVIEDWSDDSQNLESIFRSLTGNL